MAPKTLANDKNAHLWGKKQKQNSFQYFTYYTWHYSSRHLEMFLRIEEDIEKYY